MLSAWLPGKAHSFSILATNPLVPSVFMHGGDVSRHIEVVQIMMDSIKTVLEEAQANLTVA